MTPISRWTILLFGMIHACPVLAQGSLSYPSVWSCTEAKFTWYCDPEEALAPPQAPSKAPTPPTTAAKPKPLTSVVPKPAAVPKRMEIQDITTTEALRSEMKRREDLAIMVPTESNIKDYLEINAFMQAKSSVFADQWRRVVWQTPELDYTQRNPSNNAGIRIAKQEREHKVEASLSQLAKEHGLLFFFRSDCPYCHAMAPNLRLLTEKYGFEVLAVSMDGKPIPGMTHWVKNQGQYEKLVTRHNQTDQRVPALFLASKKTGDTAPIGVGTLAFTEITDRIYVLTSTQPGQEF
jgi:conjugal transfer pilus assembly protein TraF